MQHIAEGSVLICFEEGPGHHQFVIGCRTVGYLWLVLHKQLCQISRCQAVQTLEDKLEDLIVSSFTHRQPMPALEGWGNMLVFASSGDQPGSSVLNQLQGTDLLIKKTLQQGVA